MNEIGTSKSIKEISLILLGMLCVCVYELHMLVNVAENEKKKTKSITSITQPTSSESRKHRKKRRENAD